MQSESLLLCVVSVVCACAALFGLLFADDQEPAFSCYRTFQTLGLIASFLSSTTDLDHDPAPVMCPHSLVPRFHH